MAAAAPSAAPPLVVRFGSVLELSDDQFFQFCGLNPELRLERTAEGDVVIMSPVGTRSGARSGELFYQLKIWAERDGTGVAFDSSTGFTLPNGAVRSPDASWILKSRLAQVPDEDLEKFARICADFVAELRSPSDTVAGLQEKMREYMLNGARLGWLIDPFSRRAWVYRPNQPVEELENPETLSGEAVLPGLVLRLAPIC